MATDTSEKEQAQADWDAQENKRLFYLRESRRGESTFFDLDTNRNGQGMSGLHWLALASRYDPTLLDQAKAFILESQNSLNQRNIYGQTPLHFAATNKERPELLDYMLATGKAAVNAQDQWGLTSLHYATLYGVQPKTAIALLDAGADPSIKDMLGHTPLEIIKKVTGTLSSTEAEWRLKDAKWWRDTDFAACPKCGCRCCGAAATARPDAIIDAAAKDAST